MKKLLVLILVWSANGKAIELPHPSVPCPKPTNVVLEVVGFSSLHSADLRIDKGQCTLKTNYYSWWETLPDYSPKATTVTGNCNKRYFILHQGKLFIRANLSYIGKVSQCGSKLGCNLTCQPVVALWSF